MKLIETIKEIWEYVMIRGEELSWQHSPARMELAVTRISRLKAYTSQPYGGTLENPYADLYEDK